MTEADIYYNAGNLYKVKLACPANSIRVDIILPLDAEGNADLARGYQLQGIYN
jgi:hypothetical protein